jgi:hypothetical protein
MKPMMLAVLISACLPVAFGKEAATRPPTLAVTVSGQATNAPSRANVEDVLIGELGNQPFMQLVDRERIEAVLKEHAIALSNPGDMKNTIALGKFVGADFLLHVLVERNKASVRLVEVATGQVTLEEQVALSNDLALSAAAIREKVLRAVRPESQAANRLTVGIAAFPNRSGTDRSDKLGIELQKALRGRLRQEAWAVVLERQYPTALLEEVDLARSGLVRDKAVETLPPADLVILGTLQDANNEYVPGRPWEVKLDLTVRLRGHSSQIGQTCRSDAVHEAAEHIMGTIDEFRRQPISQSALPEKEMWRRQAMYLMPPSSDTVGRRPHDCWGERTKQDTIETIRAWENVLLLDADDLEAMTNLGVCLIALNQLVPRGGVPQPTEAQRQAAAAQCVAGSRLVERALGIQPTRDRATTFIWCIDPLIRDVPARAKEMAQYVLDHRSQFKGVPPFCFDYVIPIAQSTPHWDANASDDKLYEELDRAILNAEKYPDAVFLAFEHFENIGKDTLEQNITFYAKYLDSPDPVVQFVVQRAMGALLCYTKNDPAGLKHYDRAIEVMDAARVRLAVYYRSDALHDIYRLKINACGHLGRLEEAKKAGLAGTKHFLEAGQFDSAIAWLYHYCVAEVLGAGQEKQALAICDEYIAGANRPPRVIGEHAQRILGKREELLARLAGKSVPALGGLRLARGTEGTNMLFLRMAATDRKLWLASPQGPSCATLGAPLLYRSDLDEARKLLDWPATAVCVTAMKNAVFFGGQNGLYKLDTNGKLLKHYSRKSGSFPVDNIVDLCEGGDNIYMCYRDAWRFGIVVLDPASEEASVLAPSSRDAKPVTEPVDDVYRVWWDTVSPRLYASRHDSTYWTFRPLRCQYGLMPDGKAWQRYDGEETPRFVVSDGDEALFVRVRGKQIEFGFPRTGQKVTAEVPLPSLMGDPAWDEHRIWVPTVAGLYEIDRATSRITWLAYQNDTPFFSVLKQDGRLYVATARGLYYREIPKMTKK